MANPTEDRSSSAAPEPRLRVLLIEDNEDFAETFAILLEHLGCRTDWKSDAKSAFDAARGSAYNVIFCDISLPGEMNGLQFAQSMRAEPELADAFLVSISGYADIKSRETAVNAGFDHVLTKPVKLEDVHEVLHTATRHMHLK